MNHTLKRLFEYSNFDFPSGSIKNLTLIAKYGFDGTNVTSYHQASSDINADYSNIFVSSMVPLQLLDETGTIYWQNQRPSSSRYCRTLRVAFEKETEISIKAEERRLKGEIENLKNYEGFNCNVSFDMKLTMVDGKVI